MKNLEPLKELLESLGLENNEAITYLEALKLGTSPASSIANKVGVSRTSIRYTCEVLVKKGLMIASKKGNTKLFTAETPNKLKNLLILEKNKLEIKEKKLENNFDDLLNLYNPYTKVPKMTFYEGEDGIKKVLEDHLKSENTIYSYLDLDNTYKNFDKIQKWYVEKRSKLNLKKVGIFYTSNSETKENFINSYSKEKYNNINNIKFIDNSNIKLYIAAYFYDGKFSYISLNEKGGFGVIIEDDEIYKFNKSIFDFMWENGKDNL